MGLSLSNSKVSKKKYDICIISWNGRRDPNSIDPNSIDGTFARVLGFGNRKIDSIIKKYIGENNLKLVIAPKHEY